MQHLEENRLALEIARHRLKEPQAAPPGYESFEEGAEVGAADEEEPDLVAEDASTLFTRGVREIAPWPVEILDLPDPTEPELLVTGTHERHSTVGAAQTSQARVWATLS